MSLWLNPQWIVAMIAIGTVLCTVIAFVGREVYKLRIAMERTLMIPTLRARTHWLRNWFQWHIGVMELIALKLNIDLPPAPTDKWPVLKDEAE